MSPSKRYAKKHAKARQRRRLHAHERLERDRRQAQRVAEALHQALEDLGLPPRAAGNGRGYAMTRGAESMGSSGDAWAPGGAVSTSAYWRALMASCWWSSSVMGAWSSQWTVPFGGPIPVGLERPAGTHGT